MTVVIRRRDSLLPVVRGRAGREGRASLRQGEPVSLGGRVVASSVAADAEASVRRAGIKLDRRRKVGAESGMQVMSRIGANLVAGARARMDMRAPYSTGGGNFSVLQ